MNQRPLSRRNILVAGAAASATAAGVATLGTGSLAGAAGGDDPRNSTETVGDVRRVEALTAIAPGEQVIFIAPAAMVPNAAGAGTTSVVQGNGVRPANGAAVTPIYVSATFDVPLGSVLTNIEWIVNGNPQAGRVALLKWTPDTGAAFTVLAATNIGAGVNGRTTYTSAITPTEIYSGTQAYEVYYRLDNAPAVTPIYVSATFDVPLGSVLTNIEWIVNGTPQAGRVALLKWTPDTGAGFVVLAATNIGAGVNGRTTYTSAITPTEIYNGTQAYEVYYRIDNAPAVTTSAIEGVRVRYLPPGQALTPVTPVRVYDSRLNMAPDPNGPIASGSTRTISVAGVRNVTTGALTGVDAVPANATAVAFTLTLADTALQGFLAVNPGGVTAVSASTINWKASGLDLANTGVVKLGPTRTLTVIAGGGGSTNFVVDIVGYYM